MKRSLLALVCLLTFVSIAPIAQSRQAVSSTSSLSLAPTIHPQVPTDPTQFWLTPDRSRLAVRTLPGTAIATAAKLAAEGQHAKALTTVSQPGAAQGPLAQYAMYYAGVSQVRLDRASEALKSFRNLLAQKPVGFLWEAASIGEAEALEALGQTAEAIEIYKRLLRGRLTDVEDVYMRLGKAAVDAGDSAAAVDAFAHVFYEFPLGENAAVAGSELKRLGGLQALTEGSPRYAAELGRAERFFLAKRYAEARAIFRSLADVAAERDRQLVELRIAECDHYTKRYRDARDTLKALAEGSERKAEALYFLALATRGLGDTTTYLRTLERVEADFPTEPWAEEALNALATHYIRVDDDERADAIFKEMFERFPRGSYAERAAWKLGWTAYRDRRFDDTIQAFERGSSVFPRSDYRPAWLYWSGRAHHELGHTAQAQQRFTLTVTDYANSYYGRMALKRLDAAAAAQLAAVRATPEQPASSTLPPNGTMVTTLLAAGLFDDAERELRYAQRVWGDSPAIQATLAWTVQKQSPRESGMRRLQMVRSGMNGMRRAYPQFMAVGGEQLPREVLNVIFPLAYWDLIREHAQSNGLDPYFVAALVAQESTFVADVRSAANAYGLMQLLPSTARLYARKLNLQYSTRLLTDPESNIRMGTAYLADKIREFGDPHLALASYNAGERAVRRWVAERPGLDVDEFVDDIPYPETQGYVKKILGTADDYRQLYGAGSASNTLDFAPPPSSSAPTAAPVVQRTQRATEPKAKSAPAKPGPRKPAARKPAPRKSTSH